ncbi:MAG: hypothetical protein K0S33_2980 [Bacteroidetes bacterium]|jgi:hypothetical protein|nr:hypothetical protein [Bacteroidota bacterium]
MTLVYRIGSVIRIVILTIIVIVGVCRRAHAQINIPNTTPVVENFNTMNAGTTTAANWRIHQSAVPAWAGATTTGLTAANSGTPATGDHYNWGTTAGTDRALGVMTSGSFSSPNSVIGWFRNTNASNLSQLTVSYDLERYRINSAAASVQFFYSTDGSTWTSVAAGDIAAATIGTGASAYSFAPQATFSVASFTITGLTVATNGDIYLRWNLNTTGSNSQGIGIDNVNVTAAFAAACSPPSTQASSLSSTPLSCTSVTLDWVRGNGNAVLVTGIGGASSTTNPTSGTGYTGNSVFTAGSSVGGGYAVYNGTGTTVTITGLAGNTQYTFAVYEYATTGTCYLSSPATVTFTTSACASSQCAYITSVLVNSCDGSGCNEGDNEILFLNTGSSPLNAVPANVQTYYGSSAAPATNYSESFATNAATISAMNTSAGCGGLFVDASSGSTIPANSTVLLVRSSLCQNGYDWTNLCGSGPIYVLFSTDASWAVGGNFVNGSGGMRYFRTTYSGCVTDYSYDSDVLPAGNGAYIVYGTSGGAPAGYFNDGCALSVIVLPVHILHFSAQKINNSVRLNWITTGETNVDHFGVEKSGEGVSYTVLGLLNSNPDVRNNIYMLNDEAPGTGINYYRLFTVSKDGKKQYHQTISYDQSDPLAEAYTITYSEGSILFRIKEVSTDAGLSLYNLSGQVIKTYMFDPADNGILKIGKESFEKGMYIARIQNGTRVYNDKIIIQ